MSDEELIKLLNKVENRDAVIVREEVITLSTELRKRLSSDVVVLSPSLEAKVEEIRERQRKHAEEADLWMTGYSPAQCDIDTLLSIIEEITKPSSELK